MESNMRLAIFVSERSNVDKIGSPVDQLLLYCFHYDPATGKYGAVVMNMIRLGGIATVGAMLTLLLLLRRRGPAATGELDGETANPGHRYGRR
jgi:hypothetical protein